MATLVLTVIGDDRPGLVSDLSSTLRDQGAGWERSRMAHLAGKFAGILEVIVPEDAVDTLADAVRRLDAKGLHVAAERTGEPDPRPGQAFTLELVGADRPGIVAEISTLLANEGVNVEELTTQVREAPMAGGHLFEARALLIAPARTSTDGLRIALEALADELMVEVSLGDPALG